MAGYIGTAPVPQATQRTGKIVATEGQTSFPTAGYTPNYIFVWLNGIKLVTVDDYDATNGSDIVLTTGASENDILEYLVFDPFEVAGQTWTGDHTFTGNVNVEGELEVEDDLEVQGDATFTGSLFNINSGTEFPVLNFAQGAIAKSNSDEPAWSKEDDFEISTSQPLTVEVDNRVYKLPQDTEVIMPASPVVGNDYAIWVTPGGDLVATEDFSSAPESNSRRIGGFHYAPGGNAPLDLGTNSTGGGDDVEQINEYTFWDLKWKPAAKDPRGLTLVGDGAFWAGIYHLSANHLTGPVHKYNVDPARDGNAPQNLNGTGNYPNASPANLLEVLEYHGFRAPNFWEFQLLAFGAREGLSLGTSPISGPGLTGVLDSGNGDKERFTSAWGVFDAVGVLNHWGNDTILATSDQLLPNPARGGIFRYSHFVRLGGDWGSGAVSGSRIVTIASATTSGVNVGARGISDHVILP